MVVMTAIAALRLYRAASFLSNMPALALGVLAVDYGRHDWPHETWRAILEVYGTHIVQSIANMLEAATTLATARAYRWLRRVSPEMAALSATVTQQRIRTSAHLLVISQRRREAVQPGPRWTVQGLPLPRTQRALALSLLAGGATTGKPAVDR